MEKIKKNFENPQPPLGMRKYPTPIVYYPTNTPPYSGTRKNSPAQNKPISAVFAIKIGKYIIRYFERK